MFNLNDWKTISNRDFVHKAINKEPQYIRNKIFNLVKEKLIMKGEKESFLNICLKETMGVRDDALGYSRTQNIILNKFEYKSLWVPKSLQQSQSSSASVNDKHDVLIGNNESSIELSKRVFLSNEFKGFNLLEKLATVDLLDDFNFNTPTSFYEFIRNEMPEFLKFVIFSKRSNLSKGILQKEIRAKDSLTPNEKIEELLLFFNQIKDDFGYSNLPDLLKDYRSAFSKQFNGFRSVIMFNKLKEMGEDSSFINGVVDKYKIEDSIIEFPKVKLLGIDTDIVFRFFKGEVPKNKIVTMLESLTNGIVSADTKSYGKDFAIIEVKYVALRLVEGRKYLFLLVADRELTNEGFKFELLKILSRLYNFYEIRNRPTRVGQGRDNKQIVELMMQEERSGKIKNKIEEVLESAIIFDDSDSDSLFKL